MSFKDNLFEFLFPEKAISLKKLRKLEECTVDHPQYGIIPYFDENSSVVAIQDVTDFDIAKIYILTKRDDNSPTVRGLLQVARSTFKKSHYEY